MNTLHILSLHLDLNANLSLNMVFDDPLATLDNGTGIVTVELPRNPRGKQSVRFVIQDPGAQDGTHFYATLQSRPPSRTLTQWHKDGDISRSPYIPADTTIEVWATVLAIPTGDPKAARVYHGRRNVKIATQGGGDLGILNL